MAQSWKKDLGEFMSSKRHYDSKTITEVLILPSLEDLKNEFNKYDDFESKHSSIMKSREPNFEYGGADYLIHYFRIYPKKLPNFWVNFGLKIYLNDGTLCIEDISRRDFTNNRTEEEIDYFSIHDIFERDFLSAVITKKFKDYYLECLEYTSDKDRLNLK